MIAQIMYVDRHPRTLAGAQKFRKKLFTLANMKINHFPTQKEENGLHRMFSKSCSAWASTCQRRTAAGCLSACDGANYCEFVAEGFFRKNSHHQLVLKHDLESSLRTTPFGGHHVRRLQGRFTTVGTLGRIVSAFCIRPSFNQSSYRQSKKLSRRIFVCFAKQTTRGGPFCVLNFKLDLAHANICQQTSDCGEKAIMMCEGEAFEDDRNVSARRLKGLKVHPNSAISIIW